MWDIPETSESSQSTSNTDYASLKQGGKKRAMEEKRNGKLKIKKAVESGGFGAYRSAITKGDSSCKSLEVGGFRERNKPRA